MNIASVEFRELLIPFRFRYGHAKATHSGVQSVVCIVRDANGLEGYGEAVPRSYVTGESTASIVRVLPSLISDLLDRATTFDAFRNRLSSTEESWTGPIPACALCALELAVVDLAARQAQKTVHNLLNSSTEQNLTYTASIGMGSRIKLTPLLLLYKSMGFRSFKVKVGNEGDLDRIQLIHRILGSDIKLFADANGAWDKESAARYVEKLASLGVWAIEEPLRISTEARVTATGQLDRESLITDQHLQDNAWLQARSQIPLIADETLISLDLAKRIIEHRAFEIFNIRLSKCGGYLRSSQFATMARTGGLAFSLGAMVGESPILAAAGAAWGAAEPDRLYIQGHSHRILHGARLAEGCPSIGHNGRLRISQNAGTGLSLNSTILTDATTSREVITL